MVYPFLCEGINISSPILFKLIPSFSKTEGIFPRKFQLTFLMVISLLVIAARPIQLPISIISGSILCLAPFNLFTPSITNKLEPIPLIFAPILFNKRHNC